jgi:hypothetical protein
LSAAANRTEINQGGVGESINQVQAMRLGLFRRVLALMSDGVLYGSG